MLRASVKYTLHPSSTFPSFLRSYRICRLLYPVRGLHTTSQTPSRQAYTLKILASASIILGLTCYVIRPQLVVPHNAVPPDLDEVTPADTESESPESSESSEPTEPSESSEESEDPSEGPEPPEDFTTNPPLVYNRSFWEPSGIMSLEDHLSLHSHIYPKVDIPCGVRRYDVSVVGKNTVSCFSSASFIEIPTHYWLFFGIYDGHNGNGVSSYIARALRQTLMDTLYDLYSKHTTYPGTHVDVGNTPEFVHWNTRIGRPYPPADEFDDAIKQSFIKLDKEIVEEAAQRALEAAKHHLSDEPPIEGILAYQDAIELVSRAYCGSSALVAVYENDTRQLRMANTGNSRAVLGRRGVNDKGQEVYEVHVLTQDMGVPSGFKDDPVCPNPVPPQSVHAFGDGPWKWSAETLRQLKDAFPFIDESVQPSLKASVEPVITTFETHPGDFLVLANQGLWASLTNEEVVGLVALWLRKHEKTVFGDDWVPDSDGVDVFDSETSSVVRTLARVPISATRNHLNKDVFVKEDLPVQHPGKDKTLMHQMWGSPKRFVLADKNAAQHLVRNALGGADTDLLEALVRMQTPRSRPYRNDVSVEIVFFG